MQYHSPCTPNKKTAQSAVVIEYADCITAESLNPLPSNKCPGYDTKSSDGEAPILEL